MKQVYKFCSNRERQKCKSCPCGKDNKDQKFHPFEGTELYGYCHACARNILPENEAEIKPVERVFVPPVPIAYHAPELVEQTMGNYLGNTFVSYLRRIFGDKRANELVSRYRIGTSKQFGGGAVVFWYINTENAVTAGKIMQYGQDGKRVKDPRPLVTWVHKVLKLEAQGKFSACPFGLHLLAENPYKPVCIVESEKTAIIASGYISDCIWIATGGKATPNAHNYRHLSGRTVILFPDLKAEEVWAEFGRNLRDKYGATVSVSSILQGRATEEEVAQGFDLADFLTREPYKPHEEPYTDTEIQISKFVRSNPELLKLIQTFQIINRASGEPFNPDRLQNILNSEL